MSGIVSFVHALGGFMSVHVILLMAVSTALGIIIGALPGLTATMGIALLTGLTFQVSKTDALTVLMGIYVGAIYGGSLSAILINVPGTGSAAATVIEGHVLALKGEAAPAIRATRTASIIGTALGLLALLLVTPFLTKMALNFASPEFFMLGFFGVLICGSVGAKDLTLKGWIAGCIGLIFAFVGQEDIHSAQRFMFGMNDLTGGVAIIPAMIGFYAIPEVIKSLTGQNKLEIVEQKRVKKPMLPILKKNIKTIIQSALIGIGIGALPGVGEDVAAWVSYATAKRTSKHPEEFGKGSYEGVIAPEVGNNAAIGGAIIPLLSLAVPGSPPAAVLLGALMLHGIRPGPMLAQEFPNFTYEIGALVLLATFMLWVIGMLIARPISKVLEISPAYLMPVVTALSVIGAYAINLSFFDLTMVLIFGVMGYFLDKMEYSPAPIVLGLILGTLIDVNFRRTLMVNNGSFAPFVTRPISLVFLIVIVVTIVNQVRASVKASKNEKATISE